MKKLSDFINNSSVPARLIRSTVRQVGGWAEFTERAEDIFEHGAAGGFSGFIYYSDTLPFARRNMRDILTVARDLAQCIGENDEYQLIAGFNCLRGQGVTIADVAKAIHTGKGDDVTTILNALAWCALEEVASSYCNGREG
jgi:hypothetical protein